MSFNSLIPHIGPIWRLRRKERIHLKLKSLLLLGSLRKKKKTKKETKWYNRANRRKLKLQWNVQKLISFSRRETRFVFRSTKADFCERAEQLQRKIVPLYIPLFRDTRRANFFKCPPLFNEPLLLKFFLCSVLFEQMQSRVKKKKEREKERKRKRKKGESSGR